MNTLPPFAALLVGSLARIALTAAGTYAAAHGYLDAAGSDALLQQGSGFAMIAATVVWAAVSKHGLKKKVDGPEAGR